MWRPYRSPHIGRALVPASTAVARYASTAADRAPLDGPRAHHAAGDRDHQDGHDHSKDSAHTRPMANRGALDHTDRTICVNGGRE